MSNQEYFNSRIKVEIGREITYPGSPIMSRYEDLYPRIDFKRDFGVNFGIPQEETEVVGKQSYSTPSSFGWQECDVVETTYYLWLNYKEYVELEKELNSYRF